MLILISKSRNCCTDNDGRIIDANVDVDVDVDIDIDIGIVIDVDTHAVY